MSTNKETVDTYLKDLMELNQRYGLRIDGRYVVETDEKRTLICVPKVLTASSSAPSPWEIITILEPK